MSGKLNESGGGSKTKRSMGTLVLPKRNPASLVGSLSRGKEMRGFDSPTPPAVSTSFRKPVIVSERSANWSAKVLPVGFPVGILARLNPA